MKTLTYSPLAGTTISHACKEAVAMAMKGNAKVKFTFNGIEMEATPESSPESLNAAWSVKMDREAEAYRKSPKGIADKERRVQETLHAQRSVNTSLDVLGNVIHDNDRLMLWLKSFTNDSDRVGVQFSKDRLVSQLEEAGFSENQHVGNDPSWFNTRPRMAQYIMGQVINCLKMGMGPHPVTMSFVDRYFEIPEGEQVKAA